MIGSGPRGEACGGTSGGRIWETAGGLRLVDIRGQRPSKKRRRDHKREALGGDSKRGGLGGDAQPLFVEVGHPGAEEGIFSRGSARHARKREYRTLTEPSRASTAL